MQLIITVDTEADHQRTGDDPVVLDNLAELPRFQAVCERYGFVPTYLITEPVAHHIETAAYLRDWQRAGVAEVGAHLHPWTSEPRDDGDVDMRFPSELSDEQLRAKLTRLTGQITEHIGVAPTSYRAGRWGYDSRQGKILADLGYVADCSITPKVSWKGMKGAANGNGGPDWRFEMVLPHKRDGILEVPMTILFTGLWKRDIGAQWFSAMTENFVKRVINRLVFRQKWLRVFHNSTADDWQRLYTSAQKNNLPVLEFMIHSSELALGTSPYTKTQQQLDHVYTQLEALFGTMQRNGVTGVTLSDFAKLYDV